MCSLTGSSAGCEDFRKEVCDFMEKKIIDYYDLVELDARRGIHDWTDYMNCMRTDEVWGDNVELHAASRLVVRPSVAIHQDLV